MNSETSSSSTTNIPPSSATNSTPQGEYLRQYAAPPKPLTVGQIRANGDVKTRMGILWFVGVVTVGLIVIGESLW